MSQYKKMKEAWDREDRAIRGEIARYLEMQQLSKAELAEVIGVSQTTLYQRMKDPGAMTLGEYRKLFELIREMDA